MKAHGLKNPKSKNSAHILDLSFICKGDEVCVVLRQCDYDRIERMKTEKAREMYRGFLKSGYVACEPTYNDVVKVGFRTQAIKAK